MPKQEVMVPTWLRAILISAAAVGVFVHVSAIIESPADVATAMVEDLVRKGADLTSARRAEIYDGLYATQKFNRVVDGTLAASLTVAAVLLASGKIRWAFALGLFYSIANIAFLMFAWGALEYGAARVVASVSSRLISQFRNTSPLNALSYVARPATLAFSCAFIVAALGWSIVRLARRSREPHD